MILVYALAALVFAADIATKLWISNNFVLYRSEALIPGVLNITNIANDGIAFGWMDGARWLFMLVTVIMVIAFAVFLVFVKGYHKTVYVSAALIFGGGLGNLVDRIVSFGPHDVEKCVVDFIDFCAFPEYWMWTFNVADMGVCIGVGLLIVYLIFMDKKAYKAGYKAVLYEEKESGGKADE